MSFKKYTDEEILAYRDAYHEKELAELATWENVDFSRNNFEKLDMSNIIVRKSNFSNMNISTFESVIFDSFFIDCIFENCTFKDVRIIGNDFRGCNFINCKFINCELFDNMTYHNTLENVYFESSEVDFFSDSLLNSVSFKDVIFKYFEFLDSIIQSKLNFNRVVFADERTGTKINIGTFKEEKIIEGEEALEYFVEKSTFESCTFSNRKMEELVDKDKNKDKL